MIRKGVVHTTATLRAQMDAMLQAWSLSKNDTVLNVLPLHHVHGMINCVMSPLYAGGTVVMMNKFDAEQVRPMVLFRLDHFVPFTDMEASTR